jgi:hypothetical protein
MEIDSQALTICEVTEDGFRVCFSMPRERQGELAEALLTEHPTGTTTLAS